MITNRVSCTPFNILCKPAKYLLGTLKSAAKNYSVKEIVKSSFIGSFTMPTYVFTMDKISQLPFFSFACAQITGITSILVSSSHHKSIFYHPVDHAFTHHIIAGALVGGTASILAQKLSTYPYFKEHKKISLCIAGSVSPLILTIGNLAYFTFGKMDWSNVTTENSLENMVAVAAFGLLSQSLAPVGMWCASKTSTAHTQSFDLPDWVRSLDSHP